MPAGSGPTGLAFDSSGNLYVSNDGGSGVIDKFDTTGHMTIFASGFSHPHGLAFDSNGNLFPDGDPLTAESDAKETRGYAEALIHRAE